MVSMESIYLAIPLASLLGALIAGFFGNKIGRTGAHSVTILGVAVSFILSLIVLKDVAFDGAPIYNQSVYTWMISDGIRFEVGFLIDGLTALMIAVVTGVSLMVHIYTIGYMHDDDGYQRFFCYISLFTFSMLMLVMSNNFLQLFFGWEAVGLVSYLLIGFWFKRETAIYANMKAFLVNRVGDFGFSARHRRGADVYRVARLLRSIRPGRCDGDGDDASYPRPRLVGNHAGLHPAVYRCDG